MSTPRHVLLIVGASLVIAVSLSAVGVRILKDSPTWTTGFVVFVVTIAAAVAAAYGVASAAAGFGVPR
jgi:TRAP-type C4-dicarboxylate transport system permease small subunit